MIHHDCDIGECKQRFSSALIYEAPNLHLQACVCDDLIVQLLLSRGDTKGVTLMCDRAESGPNSQCGLSNISDLVLQHIRPQWEQLYTHSRISHARSEQ